MGQKIKYKICLVGDSLSGGGAERAQAFLSDYFATKGIEVHHIIVQDKITYTYSGKLLNLGKLKNKSNNLKNKVYRLIVLKRYLNDVKFDYIIDFRLRTKPVQDFIISRFIYNTRSVFSIHSSFLNWYLPNKPWLAKLIYSNCYGVQSITIKMKDIIEKHYKLKNVITIYNGIDTNYVNNKLHENNSAFTKKYIIAMGRMDDSVKQFDKMITAYSKSELYKNDVCLYILGDGVLKEKYVTYVKTAGLDNKVLFKGFQENPYIYLYNALFFVLSSKFEGLPMVLLESLACGTPVVSFDCVSGPSEIIQHEKNGLLVKNQDFDELTINMNRMYNDKNLYTACKQNAVASIEKFSLENIGKQWLNYLNINIDEHDHKPD